MPELRYYRVIWEIDIVAKSPRHAAEQALQVQRDICSRATVFEVRVSDSDVQTIDLDVEPRCANPEFNNL